MMYNAAVRGSPKMEIPHAASRSLDYASGLQLAWALIWPTIVFDLVVWGPRDNLGLTPQQVDSVDSILMMIGLFVIMPWVVRRAVRLNFHGFHLLVVRSSGEETRSMKYSESLRVAWLLAWRGGIILAIVLGLIYAVLWAVRGTRPDIQFQQHVAYPGFRGLGKKLVVELVECALVLIIFVIWTLKGALNKQYSDFLLKLAGA
jgi:hypothetical protein